MLEYKAGILQSHGGSNSETACTVAVDLRDSWPVLTAGFVALSRLRPAEGLLPGDAADRLFDMPRSSAPGSQVAVGLSP